MEGGPESKTSKATEYEQCAIVERMPTLTHLHTYTLIRQTSPLSPPADVHKASSRLPRYPPFRGLAGHIVIVPEPSEILDDRHFKHTSHFRFHPPLLSLSLSWKKTSRTPDVPDYTTRLSPEPLLQSVSSQDGLPQDRHPAMYTVLLGPAAAGVALVLGEG